MIVKFPPLQTGQRYVNPDGSFTQAYIVYWQQFREQLESVLNAILAIPEIEEALQEVDEATQAAQDAADLAIAAAATAQEAADDTTSASSLANSYVIGLALSASDAGSDAAVSISSHTRVYGNGDSVSVDGGSIPGLAYSTTYYLYYDQPSRAGGAVTYQAATSINDVAQIGDRHSVGKVITPAALDPPASGLPVSPPGGNYAIP